VDLDTKVLSERGAREAIDVFMGQILEVADAFPQQLPDAAAARAAFVAGGGDDASGAPLLQELVAFHSALTALIERREVNGDRLARLRACQGHVESLLEEHLEERGPASTWMPPVTAAGALADEAWTVVDALLGAASLQQARPDMYPLARIAADAALSAFASQAEALYEMWQARPADQLKEIARTVQELSMLAEQVAKRPALAELRGVELEAWAGRVDTLLQQRLGARMEDIARLWRPALDVDRPLADVITQVELELNGIAAKIGESQKRGLFDVAVVLKELEEAGPIRKWLPLRASTATIVELREWSVPTAPAQVTGDPQFQQLDTALDQVRAAASGEALAAEYAKAFAGTAALPPAPNAGIRLVQRLRADFAGKLRSEVRDRYLESLQGLLEGPRYRELFDVLFWQPGDATTDYRDTYVRDKLDTLLKKKNGDLDKLLVSFRLTGPQGIQAELFPTEPAADESDWAAVHRFLAGLAEFLQAGDEKSGSVLQSKFNFTLMPAPASGSVWDLDSLPIAERKDWFYYPGNDSAEELQKVSLHDVNRQRVTNWGFEVSRDEREFLLLWSKQAMRSQAVADASRYSTSFPGCLGPLLLAWSGRPRDEETRDEFEVSPPLTGTRRLAPMRIQFERPIPVRPPKP
jgi:hypothetical protein